MSLDDPENAVAPNGDAAVSAGSVLSKKVKRVGQADALGEDPDKPFARAIAKAGESYCGLAVHAGDVKHSDCALPQLEEMVTPHALLLQLHRADGAIGLAILCKDMVAALVEKITLSQVSQSPAPERAPTPTDARLAGPFITSVLNNFPTPNPFEGAQVDGTFASPRSLSLVLAPTGYKALRFELSLENDAKKGSVSIAMPEALDIACNDPAQDDNSAKPAQISDLLQDARASLQAVLHRVPSTLSKLKALEVGAHISIPRNAPQSLEILGPQGGCIATADLGMIDGFKAIRLHHEKDLQSVVQDPARDETITDGTPP